MNLGAVLLNDVLQDIQNVRLVCESKRKQTNRDRELISDLAKGILPKEWNRYTVPQGVTVIQWVSDFSERIKQLQAISAAAASGGAAALKVRTKNKKGTQNYQKYTHFDLCINQT